jgi:hypothetical protein
MAAAQCRLSVSNAAAMELSARASACSCGQRNKLIALMRQIKRISNCNSAYMALL